MSAKYALAPEFARLPSFTIPGNRLLLRGIDALLRFQRRKFAFGDAVDVRTHRVRGEDGHVTPVFEIAPKGLPAGAPALLDYHGGGFFLSYAGLHASYAERYALDARCRVFFPDYRLSIDHPFPAALNDCYAALGWVHANAGELGVDPRRVALIGDSAGGALAAGVAQMAFDRSEHPVCAQILIYPVTDHESKTESVRAFTDTPMWRAGSNLAMWKVYLRDTAYARNGNGSPVPAYAAPLHRSNFAGLPPAFVEVAEFDPLRDEGIAYANALEEAGVPCTLRQVRGAVHGYDLVENSPTADAVYKERIAQIQRFFGAA